MVRTWRKKYWKKYTIRHFTKRKKMPENRNQIYGNLINDCQSIYWIHKHTLATQAHNYTHLNRLDWMIYGPQIHSCCLVVSMCDQFMCWFSLQTHARSAHTHSRSYLKLSNLWRNVLDFYDRYRNCLHKVTQHSQSTDTRSIWIRFGNGCVFFVLFCFEVIAVDWFLALPMKNER